MRQVTYKQYMTARGTIDCPADAICEALINSLIHRDYSIDKNAYIEFEQDRIVFITPVGSSLFDHLNSINPGEWHIHNPEIANVFRLLNRATLYGTGIPKIFKAYKGTNYEPSYRIGGDEFLMSLPLIKRPQITIDDDDE